MHFLAALVPQRFTKRQFIAAGVLFVSYFVATEIGSALFVAPTIINPASGVALAGLVLGGITLWPAIFFASLLGHLVNGSAIGYVLVLPIAHAVQATMGALILKQLNFDPLLRRISDMFSLMFVAVTASTIVPTFGLVAIAINSFFNPNFISSVTWASWWTGTMLSLLVVAAFIIRWGAEPYFRRSWKQVGELAIVFTVLIGLDLVLFWFEVGQVGGISLIYFLLVPLFWLAIRIGPRFTILALFLTVAISVLGTLFGPGTADLSPVQIGNRLFQLEIFINILAVIFYIIAGLQEERTEVTKSLQSYINKLEDALNRLSLNDRAKSDFIAVLAHELRNPLAPIVSSLEMLRLTKRSSSEEDDVLALMDDRLKTIQRLLDDLLDVSRIERSKINLKKEPVDLRIVLARAVRSIERHVQNRQQTLELDMPPEPLVLTADPVRLEQVISNLLTNATKFTPDGGRISLSAKREGDHASIRVVDTGIGIDPDMLERIFEPFLQLETGARTGEGLGIGLSLTQKLVELHEGTIEARSPGTSRGSEFIVRIPVLLGFDTTPLTTEEPSHPQYTPGGGRVLLVDDNIAAAQGIGKLLVYKGYAVEYAYTGEAARVLVSSFAPHAVVLDIGLPDTDGYALARLIRQDGYTGLLIALTGYGQDDDKQKARDAGFSYHLTKPIGIADLESVLNTS